MVFLGSFPNILGAKAQQALSDAEISSFFKFREGALRKTAVAINSSFQSSSSGTFVENICISKVNEHSIDEWSREQRGGGLPHITLSWGKHEKHATECAYVFHSYNPKPVFWVTLSRTTQSRKTLTLRDLKWPDSESWTLPPSSSGEGYATKPWTSVSRHLRTNVRTAKNPGEENKMAVERANMFNWKNSSATTKEAVRQRQDRQNSLWPQL